MIWLLLILMASPAWAETITVTWKPPTERTDGTKITEADLAHYTLDCAPNPPPFWHYHAEPIETNRVEKTKEQLGLYDEDYWCAMRVIDKYGTPSGYSSIFRVPK